MKELRYPFDERQVRALKAGSYGFSLTLVVGPAETTAQPSSRLTQTGPQW